MLFAIWSYSPKSFHPVFTNVHLLGSPLAHRGWEDFLQRRSDRRGLDHLRDPPGATDIIQMAFCLVVYGCHQFLIVPEIEWEFLSSQLTLAPSFFRGVFFKPPTRFRYHMISTQKDAFGQEQGWTKMCFFSPKTKDGDFTINMREHPVCSPRNR